MTYTLFLDDERSPTHDLVDVLVAKDADEAINLVMEMGVPTVLSLDHDLGKGPNGVKPTAMKFLWWLIDAELDGHVDLREVKQVIIHSRNPEGSKNLAGLWNGYAIDIGSPVRAELRPRATLTT